MPFISVGIGFAVTFALTLFLGFEDEVEIKTKHEETRALKQKIEVGSPAKGRAVKLADVKDETLSSGVLGKGAAVAPVNGKVVSPVNGKVFSVFPSLHAISVVDENGAELLVHIGVDTVKLDGKYFKAHVKDGDIVKKGDTLVEFDKKAVEGEGYDTTITVLVTNTQEFLDVVPAGQGELESGQTLFTIV